MRLLVLASMTMATALAASPVAIAVAVRQEHTQSATEYFIRASEVGAVLNSDLMAGGGTDDTTVLQAALDRAAGGRAVHLIVDGVALVHGLNVYGNSTIECINGGGLYLKDGSSRAIIRNVHRSREEVIDQHIAVRGCFLNGNRAKQPGPHLDKEPSDNNKEADGTYIAGLQFFGVNYLTIEDVTLWNIRAYGANIANGTRIDIRNVTVDHGAPPDVGVEYLNTDGLHFSGPLQYITIDGAKLRTGDDGIAFTADDGYTDDLKASNELGPYTGQGPILDVTVSNVQFMDTLFGFRFLSKTHRIDRVVISNVTGTLKGLRLAIFSSFMGPGSGDIGSIEINNANVDRSGDAKLVSQFIDAFKQHHNEIAQSVYDEENSGIPTFFNVNCNIENLTVKNFRTKVSDERAIIRIGPSANVQQMMVELSLLDPSLRAVPLELDRGGRIEQLSFSLDWKSKLPDLGRNPIVSLGGSIGVLRWIQTPPRFVNATLMSRNSIVVKFSQEVKAQNYATGVRIKSSGNAIGILRAFRDNSHLDSVHYQVDRAINLKSTISWSYEAADGLIQNLSGDNLLSVSTKPVIEAVASDRTSSVPASATRRQNLSEMKSATGS